MNTAKRLARQRRNFDDKIIKGDKPDDCWGWDAWLDPAGRGQFKYNGRGMMATHVAYIYEHGSMPEGHEIHHICESPECTNPRHLVALTPREHDIAHGYSDTHCPGKHLRTEDNTRHTPTGVAYCKECKAEKALVYYHKNKGAK